VTIAEAQSNLSSSTRQSNVVRLGDVMEVIRGASPRPKGDPKYFGGDIPWIMISDVTGEPGKYLSRTREWVTKAGAERSRYLPAGTLILSNSGTVCVPKILAIDGCIHDGFVAFPSLPANIDKHYLYWYFEYIRPSIIEANRQGITQVNLNTGIVKDIRLLLVSLEKQRRIVADIEKQFSRLDEAVANLKRVKANLKHYKAAVLKAAVEGRLVPTEAELARREGRSYESGAQLLQRILETRGSRWTGKGKYKEPAAADTVGLPNLPEGWAWATVDQLAAPEPNAITDGPFGTNLKTEHYQDAGPRVIRLQNIKDAEFADEYAHITQAHFERLRKHEVHADDLVIASLGENPPRACIIPASVGPAIVKADCIRFKPHPSLSGGYLNAALNCQPTRKRVKMSFTASVDLVSRLERFAQLPYRSPQVLSRFASSAKSSGGSPLAARSRPTSTPTSSVRNGCVNPCWRTHLPRRNLSEGESLIRDLETMLRDNGYEVVGRISGKGGWCWVLGSKRGTWDYCDKQMRIFIALSQAGGQLSEVRFKFSVSRSALASEAVKRLTGDSEQFLLWAGLLRFRRLLRETEAEIEEFPEVLLTTRSSPEEYYVDDGNELDQSIYEVRVLVLQLLRRAAYAGQGRVSKDALLEQVCVDEAFLDQTLRYFDAKGLVDGVLAGNMRITPAGETELDVLVRPVSPADVRSSRVTPQAAPLIEQKVEFDVFISHASEDKEPFVRSLVAALKHAGLNVWFDEFSLSLGDSLRRSIENGLKASRYGVVVLSHAFFAKKWPQHELDALFALMQPGTKKLLPIWHGLTADDVKRYSPLMADVLAARTDEGVEKVVAQILNVVKREPQ
jgi:type I restriction enzyme S subunit